MPPGGGTLATFDPKDQDVISTKLRSWNLGHPGNMGYADLLVDYAMKLPPTTAPNYSDSLNDITKQLVDVITVERGGRFLKLGEGEIYPDDCIVMDYRASCHKVLHGLKNKQKVILTKGIPPKPAKIPKPPTKSDAIRHAARPKPAPRQPKQGKPPREVQIEVPSPEVRTTGRARKMRKFADDNVGDEESPKKRRRQRVSRYEAQQKADGSINPYALELISQVCNNQHLPILAKPGAKYSTPEEEPEKEREIRLQLRHRFFAAKALKMPFVEFSRKLMEVWGGSLTVTSELVHRPGFGPPTPSPSSKQGTVTPNTQSTGGGLQNDSSDDDNQENSPKRRKMPQKEPRKPSTTNNNPQFSGIPFGEANAQDSDSSSSSSGSSSSSSDDDSDSDNSSSKEPPPPAYESPYGFGFYGMGLGRSSLDDHQNESEEEGSVRSEGDGFQSAEEYEEANHHTQQNVDASENAQQDHFYDASENSHANHDLNILSAAANYELESLNRQDDA